MNLRRRFPRLSLVLPTPDVAVMPVRYQFTAAPVPDGGPVEPVKAAVPPAPTAGAAAPILWCCDSTGTHRSDCRYVAAVRQHPSQPRERSTTCLWCWRQTWDTDAVCDRCRAQGADRDRAPQLGGAA